MISPYFTPPFLTSPAFTLYAGLTTVGVCLALFFFCALRWAFNK